MKHFSQQNTDEIYKENGQPFWDIFLVLIFIGVIVFVSFLNASSIYIPLFILFVAIGIVYLIFGTFYSYYIYSDKIEIIYWYRRTKNRCILKNEIKFVKYDRIKSGTMLNIYYLKNGKTKDKSKIS